MIALRAYIAERNPWAAARIGQRIEEAVAQLADFPLMGRSGRIEGTRELVISRTPYVAAYIVAGDEVTVLAVMHGAQRCQVGCPFRPTSATTRNGGSVPRAVITTSSAFGPFLPLHD